MKPKSERNQCGRGGGEDTIYSKERGGFKSSALRKDTLAQRQGKITGGRSLE